MGVLRFVAPFFFALSIPALYYLAAPAAPALTVLLLLAALIGAEWLSVRGDAPAVGNDGRLFRWLPRLFVPLQLGIVVWSVAVGAHACAAVFAALALSVGVTTGVFGVLAAHELVHSRHRSDRHLGLVMLTAMSYRHFRIAHVFGHHRWAATDRDPATAGLGEGFYGFLLRTVRGQFLDAWAIERRRLAQRGSPLHANRIARDLATMVFVYIVILAFGGWRAMALFAGESAVGIVVLELFNYIAHYGLSRAKTAQGHERFSLRHSWNSSNVMANALIFNMGRHSSHHARPDASFETLTWVDSAPELPAGYAGSILLALVPPLWRRVMDPAVQSLHTEAGSALQ
jgi:alkane 1-monooxygenase